MSAMGRKRTLYNRNPIFVGYSIFEGRLSFRRRYVFMPRIGDAITASAQPKQQRRAVFIDDFGPYGSCHRNSSRGCGIPN